jgi:putative ABC transport system substrate-binding protein
MISRRQSISLLGGAAAWPLAARAQQPGKIYTIGYLNPAPFTLPVPLLEGLRDLGWIEGKNIAFERRHGDNQIDRLHSAAAELVHLNVDVIVAIGTLDDVTQGGP